VPHVLQLIQKRKPAIIDVRQHELAAHFTDAAADKSAVHDAESAVDQLDGHPEHAAAGNAAAVYAKRRADQTTWPRDRPP
jgi:hypothetical protein